MEERLKVIGSQNPVTHDAYYAAKRAAGLIGPPEDYGLAHLTLEDLL